MLLEIKNLWIGYFGKNGEGVRWVVRDLSFSLDFGDRLAILGPSGVGKTSIALAMLGLLPRNAVSKGEIYFQKKRLGPDLWSKVRGTGIGIVFQHPHAYLNPLMRVLDIVVEPLVVKKRFSFREAREKAKETLFKVGLEEETFSKYPFQLSGGMAQRVAIAQTLVLEPDLIIGDEITSSLDVDLRRGILDLILRYQKEKKAGFVFISHDQEAVDYVGARTISLSGISASAITP